MQKRAQDDEPPTKKIRLSEEREDSRQPLKIIPAPNLGDKTPSASNGSLGMDAYYQVLW